LNKYDKSTVLGKQLMIDEINDSLHKDGPLSQKDADKLNTLEIELYKEGGSF